MTTRRLIRPSATFSRVPPLVIYSQGRAPHVDGLPLRTGEGWGEAARRLLLGLFLTSCSTSAFAVSNNAGSTNGAFLKIATDARGVALSDTMVSLADGTDAMRWNPAGLSILNTKEAAFTDVQYYQGVTMQNAAAFYPYENSGLAANVMYLSPGSLDGRDITGQPTGDFKFYDLAGSIGYGRKVLSREEGADVSVGASLKIVQEVIANETFQNPALDIGARAVPWDDTSFGLAVRDLSTHKADFPREIIGGGAYTWFKVFTTAAAVNYSNDAPVRFSASGEYRIPELENSVIRAGYRTHDNLDDSTNSQIKVLRGSGVAGLTMGAGINYRPPLWPTVKLLLDYAMAPFGALGISHTITLKMQW